MWLFLRFPLQKTSTVMPLLCPQSKRLITLRPYRNIVTYCRLPRSDNPIFAYALRCLLWAWQLGSARDTARYFIQTNFTLPHCRRIGSLHISMQQFYRPVHSQLCQTFPSFSPYALYRPPTYRIHRSPLSGFRSVCTDYGISQPTSPSFWQNQFLNLANRSIRGSVSRRYSLIPLLGLSVLWNWPYKLLSILYFYFTASRLTFSVRNVSHNGVSPAWKPQAFGGGGR